MSMNKREKLAVVLYFYEGGLTQDETVTILSAFGDMNVKLRRVHDRNNLQDMLEPCDYVSGAVPLLYSVRKASGVMTGGVLSDPLKRKNAAKAVKDDVAEAISEVLAEAAIPSATVTGVSSAAHVAPEGANIAAESKDEAKSEDEAPAKDTKGKKATPVAPVAPVAPAAK